MRHYPYGGSVSSVCTGSFLYLENEITSSIGNPKMADNRKMVATCQGSTCRKTLTSAAEKNAYRSLAFSLQNERNLPTAATLRDGLNFSRKQCFTSAKGKPCPVVRLRESRKPLAGG